MLLFWRVLLCGGGAVLVYRSAGADMAYGTDRVINAGHLIAGVPFARSAKMELNKSC